MRGKGDEIKLGAFLLYTGHHVAAWRHPEARADAGVSFAHWAEMAQLAERGLFDLVFLADIVALFEGRGGATHRMGRVAHFEPLTLLSALAAVTSRIGLVATMTTTYTEPYHLARMFASLDQISGGRAGWNLVTSANSSEAYNFSREAHLAHADRYERAREYAEVVLGLWDSWEDDAFVRDKASGLFFAPEKLHELRHVGPHFKVRGPLNVARSPQGRPVLVQAGSSEPGRDLAAETAEAVFTAHQTLDSARAFYADVKRRMVAFGRDPDALKIMPGVSAVVGRTRQEARDRFERLQELIHPEVGLAQLSGLVGVDLTNHPPDGPLPPIPESDSIKSRPALLVELARREGLTIRDLYLRTAGARGHWQLHGTAEDIADELEAWFKAPAADGFNVMPPLLPSSLADFVDLVIPELQRRGLFRRAYAGRTLRDQLGLPRPANAFAARSRGPLAAAG